MADNENDLSGKVGLDITDFKANISALNQQIKVAETGFKAAAAGMEDWGNDADGLQARITALTNIIDLQKQKVENLKAMYSKVAAEQGESSRAAQDLQIKINNETAALNKNQLELNGTTEKLNNLGNQSDDTGTDVKELGNDLETSGKKALSFGDLLKANVISDAIVGGMRMLGNAVQSAFGKIKELASGALETADTMQALSDETGFTAEQLQIMKYQGDDLGVSLDTMTGVQSKLIKNMASASEGTGAAAEAFKTLKVNAVDPVTGSLRDNKVVYGEVLDALGKIPNETERNALAMQIFGKSAADLNPLIKAGAAGLDELKQQAIATGAVMSDEAIAALDGMGDSLDHLKTTATSAAGIFLAQFAPGVQDVATSLARLLAGSAGTDEFVEKIGALATQATSAITSKVPDIMKVGSSILLAIVSGIAASMPEMASTAINVIMQFIATLISMLPNLINTGLEAIVQFALGIANGMPELIPTIVKVIAGISQAIINNLPLLMDAGLQLLKGLINGIVAAIPMLVSALPQLIQSITNFITTAIPQIVTQVVTIVTQNIPIIISAGVQLFTSLVNALPQIIAQITAVIPTIIDAVINAVIFAIPQLIQAGISLLTALVTALPQIIAEIVDALPQIIDGIISGLLSALPMITQAGIDLLVALISALPVIIATIIKALPQIINGIIKGLVENTDKIILAGVQLFVALVSNMPRIIVEIVKAIPQIIDAIVSAFGSYASTMRDIGLNLIKGLWNGISDAAEWLWQKISGFFGQIVDRIKSHFGIKSPARKIWPEIGLNMAKGLGVGFVDAMGEVSEQMNTSIPTSLEMTGQYKTSTAMTENLVNAIVPFLGNQSGGTTEIKLVLQDGTTLANVLFDPLLGVSKQRGVAFG